MGSKKTLLGLWTRLGLVQLGLAWFGSAWWQQQVARAFNLITWLLFLRAVLQLQQQQQQRWQDE